MIQKYFPPLRYFNLPNGLSTLSVVAGFVSLILLINKQLSLALVIYPLALIIDNFDGIIARKLNCTTEFGRNLDTFADGFNFCTVPLLMAYFLGFNSWPAILALGFYLTAGIWRLTYYSMIGTQNTGSESYFLGFTTNLCAAIFYILLTLFTRIIPMNLNLVFFSFFGITPFLMISAVKVKKYGLIAKAFYGLIPLAMLFNGFR